MSDRLTLLTAFEAGQSDLPVFKEKADPEYYGEGDAVRFMQCWGDNNSVNTNEHLKEGHPNKYTCRGCYATLTPDMLDGKDGELVAVPHLKMMSIDEQARAYMERLLDMFGFSWEAAGMYPAVTAEDHARRTNNVDLGVAVGLHQIAAALTARGSSAAIVKAVADFDGLQLEQDDAPFFTEAATYERFGKDEARTLLAFWNRIKRAVGA